MTFVFINISKLHGKLQGQSPVLKLGCLAIGLLICNVLLGYYTLHPKNRVNVLEFFPGAGGDGSRITWAHATNSKQSLEEALLSKVMVLEADVSPSPTDGAENPIMAHPPTTKSDLTLDQWLSQVTQYRKGIKLNFKELKVVGPTIEVIKKHSKRFKFPVFLSTDILQGPTNPISVPMDARKFLGLGHELPESVLSLGWTTFLDPNVPHPSYTQAMVDEMIQVLTKARVTSSSSASSSSAMGATTAGHQLVTFSIRACIAKNSIVPLTHLLNSVSGSTLTVWSSQGDPISTDDLMRFRRSFDITKVYYDLSSPLREEFLQEISRHEFR